MHEGGCCLLGCICQYAVHTAMMLWRRKTVEKKIKEKYPSSVYLSMRVSDFDYYFFDREHQDRTQRKRTKSNNKVHEHYFVSGAFGSRVTERPKKTERERSLCVLG